MSKKTDASPRALYSRGLQARVAQVDQEARTVELSFSSEEPYERWWGVEILDHKSQSVRLDRLNNAHPLLVDHNWRDQVGVVEKAWIDDQRRGRALVRFGKSARASEIFQDVVDGIRQLVSVGYEILDMVLESKTDVMSTYRVTDWQPYEISLVPIPADPTVGVGRDAADPAFDPRSLIRAAEQPAEPDDKPAASSYAQTRKDVTMSTPTADQAAQQAQDAERSRIINIRAIGGRVPGSSDLVDQAIREGWSLDKFADEIGKHQEKKPATVISDMADPSLGLDEKDVKRFSVLRLLHALANPNDRAAQKAAGYEFEVSAAAQQKLGKDGKALRGYTVPAEILRQPVQGQQRDLLVGTATLGGNTVATDLLASSFIDILRNRLSVMAAGATMLGGLNGNVAIPRQTGAATMAWVTEGNAAAESQQAFDQVTLQPRTASAWVDISRRMLLQSSLDVEAFVRGDLAQVLSLGIDQAALNGPGSGGAPRGVLQTVGINSVAIGTNGGAVAWDHVIGLETEVAVDNADVGTTRYLTNARQRGAMKRTQKFATTNGDPIWERDNTLNGYQAIVSNQVPSNLTKGTGTNLSAILFGNFADLVIGMWGGLDLTVDPFTQSTSGTVRIVALQDVDVALRRLESFAAITDAA